MGKKIQHLNHKFQQLQNNHINNKTNKPNKSSDLLVSSNTPIIDPSIPGRNLPNIDNKNSWVLLSNSNPNILNYNIQNSLSYSHPLYPCLECYKMCKIYIICRL